MLRLPEKTTQEWPIIMETTDPGKRTKGVRKFTVQDARNTWEIMTSKISPSDSIIFEIVGFSNYHFLFIDPARNESISLRCYKKKPIRVSDSGEIANYQDRFNLIDDSGKRKTLRLTNLKKYLGKII